MLCECFVMLCYVMLCKCYVMLCYVMLCYACMHACMHAYMCMCIYIHTLYIMYLSLYIYIYIEREGDIMLRVYHMTRDMRRSWSKLLAKGEILRVGWRAGAQGGVRRVQGLSVGLSEPVITRAAQTNC